MAPFQPPERRQQLFPLSFLWFEGNLFPGAASIPAVKQIQLHHKIPGTLHWVPAAQEEMELNTGCSLCICIASPPLPMSFPNTGSKLTNLSSV